jgi:hypothetical protein
MSSGGRVSLLGIPGRIPVLAHVYRMPPEYYDPTDDSGHPVLVVKLDQVVRKALVVTRTTKPYAKGSNPVAHAAQLAIGLDRPGWWRMAYPKPVPYIAFDQPDVSLCGPLDEETWLRVLTNLEGSDG